MVKYMKKNIYIFLWKLIEKLKPTFIYDYYVKLKHNKKVIKGTYTAIKTVDYVSKFDGKYQKIIKTEFCEVFKPSYYGKEDNSQIINILTNEIYIAELLNAKVIGGNYFVIVNNHCLYDYLFLDSKRYNYIFAAVTSISNNSVNIKSIDSNIRIKKAIMLVGHGANNFYHFAIDLLSRIYYIDIYAEYRSVPILIDEVAVNRYKDLINEINKHNHEIIIVKDNFIYEIEELIYPSMLTWTPIYLKPNYVMEKKDFALSDSCVRCYQELVKTNGIIPNKKIFISRKHTLNSRMVNEDKVATIFEEFGFEIIYFENMKTKEKIELLSQTSYLAGVMGAGFANMIFLPKVASVICMIPENDEYYLYSTLARKLEISYVGLDAISLDNRKYEMDLDNCRKFLSSIDR